MGVFGTLFKMSADTVKAYKSGKRESDELNELEEALKAQDRAIEQFGVAADLEADGNLDGAIRVYRAALESVPDMNCNSHRIALADLYIKAGRLDEAWGYLDGLYSRYPDLRGKVRAEQVRILKKEKKYPEALKTLILQYVEVYGKYPEDFNKERFKKDAGIITRKLGLGQEHLDYLTYRISKIIKGSSRKVTDARTLYKEFYDDYIAE